MYNVIRFEYGVHEELWNNFLLETKNSTFLFNRKFMDYHKDRFVDHSLIVFNEKNNVVACFPANEIDSNTIVSHAGLTYGAVILDFDTKLPLAIDIFCAILTYYHGKNFRSLKLKSFPRIYNLIPSDEIDYCMFLAEAELYRRDTSIVIDLINKINYSGNIRREAFKASKEGILVQEEKNFKDFWSKILIPNLEQRYGVKPVHSLEEIERLAGLFPQNIKLFTSRSIDNEIFCGTVIFEVGQAIHCQYISTSNSGRKNGALNLLFIKLLDELYREKRYFDFGIANEDDGKTLNYGLLAWKERMGGRTISHDFYKIKTSNFKKLSRVVE